MFARVSSWWKVRSPVYSSIYWKLQLDITTDLKLTIHQKWLLYILKPGLGDVTISSLFWKNFTPSELSFNHQIKSELKGIFIFVLSSFLKFFLKPSINKEDNKLSKFVRRSLLIFIIKGFRTIVFIFIVISTTFRPICALAFLGCLSNSGTFTELQTTSFI